MRPLHNGPSAGRVPNGHTLNFHLAAVRKSSDLINGSRRARRFGKNTRPHCVEVGQVRDVEQRHVDENEILTCEARKRERAEKIVERKLGFTNNGTGMEATCSVGCKLSADIT